MSNVTHIGDAREILTTIASGSVQACVTSPPYWCLRDYKDPRQIGLERTVEEYVDALCAVFSQVARILREDGTFWLNLGDTFNNYLGGQGDSRGSSGYADGYRPRFPSGHGLLVPTLPRKCLVGVPQRILARLVSAGWIHRATIVWLKTSSNRGERCRDRPSRRHEEIFLLSRSPDYIADFHRLPKEFRQSVWALPAGRGGSQHPAPFPKELVRLVLEAATDPGDLVMDPFAGRGTVGEVAKSMGRRSLLVEINPGFPVNGNAPPWTAAERKHELEPCSFDGGTNGEADPSHAPIPPQLA